MSVKIAHASIDENGKIAGGKSGDQTGKEVCIREWYNKNWNVLLRPKRSVVAVKSAQEAEAGAKNNNIGYDQNQRNTLRTQAAKVSFNLAKVGACETDCSAFMSVCAESAGVKIPYNSGNAPTTRTMRKAFVSTGEYEALTDSKYLTSDKYLKRGDILVKEGSHTVMVLENGSGAGESKTPVKSTTSQEEKFDSNYRTGKRFVVTAKNGLNIRKGAGVDNASLGIISVNTPVMWYGYYVEIDGVTWLRVAVSSGVLKGVTGYVSKNYLK